MNYLYICPLTLQDEYSVYNKLAVAFFSRESDVAGFVVKDIRYYQGRAVYGTPFFCLTQLII